MTEYEAYRKRLSKMGFFERMASMKIEGQIQAEKELNRIMREFAQNLENNKDKLALL